MFELRIITSKSLIWDVLRIESAHIFIVEFEPLVKISRVLFSFFDKTIVMTAVSGSLMYNGPNKLILKVFICLRFVVNNALVFV